MIELKNYSFKYFRLMEVLAKEEQVELDGEIKDGFVYIDTLGNNSEGVWVEKNNFQSLFSNIANLPFGYAVELLKKNHPIRRANWEKDCFIIKVDDVLQIQVEHYGVADILGNFAMMTPEKELKLGWTPSTTDLLAENWTIYIKE